jgi:hypothetical protein
MAHFQRHRRDAAGASTGRANGVEAVEVAVAMLSALPELHDGAASTTTPGRVEAGRVGEVDVVDPGIDAINHQVDPFLHLVAGLPLTTTRPITFSRSPLLIALFLATTALTSATGFPLLPNGFDPPRALGMLLLILLAAAIIASKRRIDSRTPWP